jgi:hypothetical protein
MNILVTGGDSFIARSIKASPLFKEHVLFAPSHTGLDVTKPILSFVKEHAIESFILRWIRKKADKHTITTC